MTLARLIERLGSLVVASQTGDAAAMARSVKAVTYDSRRVGPGCVFVALRGLVADGNAFIRRRRAVARLRSSRTPSRGPTGR